VSGGVVVVVVASVVLVLVEVVVGRTVVVVVAALVGGLTVADVVGALVTGRSSTMTSGRSSVEVVSEVDDDVVFPSPAVVEPGSCDGAEAGSAVVTFVRSFGAAGAAGLDPPDSAVAARRLPVASSTSGRPAARRRS
jgi:CBS domain-containing protein